MPCSLVREPSGELAPTSSLTFPRPIPSLDRFMDTSKELIRPLALDRPVSVADPPTSGRSWPLQSWARYIQSLPPIVDTIHWKRPLTFLLRGEADVCAGPVAAVYARPRLVVNSNTCRKPPLGTFKSISNPINSGAGKRTEAHCFTASVCLLRMSGSWATSVASYHRALAKGDEVTHSPRSCETKGSRKLLAALKRVSVTLILRRVSREKGITRATQGTKEFGSRVSGGPERDVWGYITTYRTIQPL